MNKITICAISLYIIGCHSADNSADIVKTDSIPFGNVQPLLEQNTPGEKIKRIDSLVEYETGVAPSLSIYYVTDKGSRVFSRNKVFDTVILKGYQANGGHDCLLKTVTQSGQISKCRNGGCTLVIDTAYTSHKAGPYPVLHPGDDTLSAPCPPNL